MITAKQATKPKTKHTDRMVRYVRVEKLVAEKSDVIINSYEPVQGPYKKWYACTLQAQNAALQ